MLKFTPTPEERALLDEHADEMEHLARADRPVFDVFVLNEQCSSGTNNFDVFS